MSGHRALYRPGLGSTTEWHTHSSLLVLIGVTQLNSHGLVGNDLSFIYIFPRSDSVSRGNQIFPSTIRTQAMARMWSCRPAYCVGRPLFNTLKRLKLSQQLRPQRPQESAGNTSKAMEKESKIPLTTENMQVLLAESLAIAGFAWGKTCVATNAGSACISRDTQSLVLTYENVFLKVSNY